MYNGTYKLQFIHMVLSNARHPMAYLHDRATSHESRRIRLKCIIMQRW